MFNITANAYNVKANGSEFLIEPENQTVCLWIKPAGEPGYALDHWETWYPEYNVHYLDVAFDLEDDIYEWRKAKLALFMYTNADHDVNQVDANIFTEQPWFLIGDDMLGTHTFKVYWEGYFSFDVTITVSLVYN